MGSTDIPVFRTIAEIQRVLVRSGATQISQEYATSASGDSSGRVIGMVFILPVDDNVLHFKLPVRTENVYNIIHSARIRQATKYEKQDREDAERIAWRQLLRWVEAQMAMVETGLAQVHEVFMPYGIDRSGKTMFEIWSQRLALPAPSGS